MGHRKDESSYWGYKEQGNGQLQSVQSFQLPHTTLQSYVNFFGAGIIFFNFSTPCI